MNRSDDKPIYSNKFYNIKILMIYVAYLKEKCRWSDEKIEHLFELCGCDITFLDSEDHWFDQELADRFIEKVQKMTGDDEIAYKVAATLFRLTRGGSTAAWPRGSRRPR